MGIAGRREARPGCQVGVWGAALARVAACAGCGQQTEVGAASELGREGGPVRFGSVREEACGRLGSGLAGACVHIWEARALGRRKAGPRPSEGHIPQGAALQAAGGGGSQGNAGGGRHVVTAGGRATAVLKRCERARRGMPRCLTRPRGERRNGMRNQTDSRKTPCRLCRTAMLGAAAVSRWGTARWTWAAGAWGCQHGEEAGL